MKSNRFKFLFAYRNIIANIKSSLVIILTLSLVFCLTILLFSMKPTFEKIYEYQAINDYQQIDIVMTYDEYSGSRLINKREVVEDYDEYIYYAMSFFNLNVLTETDALYYASMISSLPHEFEYLVDKDVLTRTDEVIITESYAIGYGLEKGDSLKFHILDKEYTYIIGDIFEDTGLFSGQTFYLDKEELLSEVYGDIYGSNLTNLGNTLYIDLNEGYEVSDVINTLENNPDFSDYYIYPAIDWEFIEVKAMDLVSVMLALGVIVLLAVFLVLDSLFPIISRDVSAQQGVVNSLGGEKSFIWHVFLIQWIIYTLISFVLGLIISTIVTNTGLSVYGIKGFIPPAIKHSIFALIIISIYTSLRAYISYKKEYNKSSIDLSKNKRFKNYKTNEYYMLIAIALLVLEYLFEFFTLKVHSLIIVILSIYITFNLISYLVVMFSRTIRKTNKHTLFSIFQLKYLENNKHLHQSLRVLVVCLIALIMIFSVRSFQYDEVDKFYNIMTYDIVVSNVHDYDESLLTEIEDNYDIIQANEGAFYRDMYITFNDENTEPCKFFVSLDYNEKSDYLNVDVLNFDETYTDNHVAYVLLPLSFELVYNLEIGDQVSVDLNYAMQDIEMEVAGFLDTNVDNLMYSNIIYVEEYKDIAIPNTIFINTDSKDVVYNDLIRDYTNDMYFIMDPDIYFGELISSIENISDFFSVFTSFMILCFVIVVFNNTLLIFYSLKSDLAKIKVLGADKRMIVKSLFKEFMLLIIIIFVIGLLEVGLLSKYLKYVVLFTNYYKDISATLLTNIYGCVIVFIVLFLSYLYYYRNINRINIIEEIKIY